MVIEHLLQLCSIVSSKIVAGAVRVHEAITEHLLQFRLTSSSETDTVLQGARCDHKAPVTNSLEVNINHRSCYSDN
jgi:hypothetical protein